jgi:conjugative relaxase-like TrwC/TraI family protein
MRIDLPLAAHASPFDSGISSIQTLFTGTVAKAASLIAIVIGGYTQARIGGNNPAETTGKFVVAKFEHDTARPVDGYAAPQLHTHAVIFNMTERPDGSTRALQPQGYFDSQQFATAVYQSELTFRLRNLGYEIEAGIRVGQCLTELPPKKVLERKLHESIALSRALLESRSKRQARKNSMTS